MRVLTVSDDDNDHKIRVRKRSSYSIVSNSSRVNEENYDIPVLSDPCC